MIDLCPSKQIEMYPHTKGADSKLSIEVLPDNVLGKIYNLLKKDSQASLRQTSRLWRKTSADFQLALMPKKIPPNLFTLFPHLRELNLKFVQTPLSQRNLASLTQSKKLKSLIMPKMGCTDDLKTVSFASLDHLTNLCWRWDVRRHTGPNWTHYQLPKHLVELDVFKCPRFDDRCLQQLRSLKNLKILNITQCEKVTPLGLKSLEGLCHLRCLILPLSGACSDHGVEIIKDFKQLDTLALSCQKISEQAVAQLGNLTKLKALLLFDCREISLVTLAQRVLKKCKDLRLLSLAFSTIRVGAPFETPIYSSSLDLVCKLALLDLSHTTFPAVNFCLEDLRHRKDHLTIEVTGVRALSLRLAKRAKKMKCGNIFQQAIAENDKMPYSLTFTIFFEYKFKAIKFIQDNYLKESKMPVSKMDSGELKKYIASHCQKFRANYEKQLKHMLQNREKKLARFKKAVQYIRRKLLQIIRLIRMIFVFSCKATSILIKK